MAVITEDREQAIRDLTRHCGDGRLTLDELEERIDEVNRATTDDEVRHALRELPVLAHEREAAERWEPERSEPERERERVVPDAVLRAPRLPDHGCGPRRRGDEHGIERTLRAVWVVGGFIALFNGMFWLAIILWFVVPKLVLPNLRRI